MLFLLVTIRTG